jgi:signal transduction histidine kinase/ligand-binding sensor domain-containing protein
MRCRRQISRLIVAAILLAAAGDLAQALDSGRTLTQYVHRIWQTQQGLPEASIYSILQTRDGYLWLGTLQGLVRFDGVTFTPIENVYSGAPSGVWIRSMIEDSDGGLWIGTNETGVFRIQNGVTTHYSQKDGLPSDVIQCLVTGKPGEIWICTSNGLARFENGTFEVYRTAQGLSSDIVRAAAYSSDGKLWIGGESTILNVWNGAQFGSQPLSQMPKDAGVRAMVGSGDTMWIGTPEGLIQRQGGGERGKERLYTTKDGLSDDWILSLAASRDGSVWIGTRNGFSRWRNGEIDSFRPQDGLSQSTVYSVLEDREGSLWAGTKHGLNQFLDGRAVPYTMNEGLPSNDTGPVIQDHDGTIWVGTLGAGLSRFDGRRFSVLTTRNGLASNQIGALATDAQDNLWVGTDRGLNRLRNGRVEAAFTTAQGLPANDIKSILSDARGRLWIGTSAGPAMFQEGVFIRPRGLSLNQPVLAMGEDNAGRLYLATANSVQIFEDGKLRELLQDNAPIRTVDAFYRDRDGLMWMGMIGGGMRMVADGKISSFFMRDGLFDNEIYGIAADAQDRLWMACSKGIFSVPRADLLRFAKGDLKRIVSSPYSPTDALRVIECKPGVQPAVSLMNNGDLWFSTIRGLIVLDPNHLLLNVPPPPVVIEDVIVNGEHEVPARVSKLAPGRKNLEFQYTGLSFLAPGRITFRYILDGYDKNWIDAGTRRAAYYTNLPPGSFRFRVTACNIDGVCNDTGSSVSFVLASHLYQRAWFWILVAALVGMSVWLAYQLRIRRLREQFSLILSERNRIARELHDTLIQGLSGITMEMQALAARLRSPAERSTLEEIIQDAGTCLRETRRSVAGLRSGTANSGLAMAIENAARQVTEAKNIRLKLKLEKNSKGFPADVEYNLVRIAQEAVSNSVKHSGARTVEVALDYTDQALHLSVKDDGSGFAENGKTGHYGLIGMKERATHIGAEFELASTPGKGTLVSVVLPSEQNGHS